MNMVTSSSSSSVLDISLIMPVYNTSEDYLRKALDSLQNQTCNNFELILINDGSTNQQTFSFLQTLDYSFIRVVHQENKGQAVARNKGLLLAKGDYIGFVDADDWVELDFYSVLYTLCQENNADIACGALVEYKEQCFQIMDIFLPHNTILQTLSEKVSHIVNGSLCSKLFRKSLFENITFPEGLFYEDNVPLLELMIASKKVAYTTKTFYYYRHNTSSTTNDFNIKEKRNMDAITILQKIKVIAYKQSQEERDAIMKCFVFLISPTTYRRNPKYRKAMNAIFQDYPSLLSVFSPYSRMKKSIQKLFTHSKPPQAIHNK